jgi:hypothetical protein
VYVFKVCYSVASMELNKSAISERMNYCEINMKDTGTGTIFLRSPAPKNVFISMAQQPLAGQGLLIIEASRSHSDTLHSVGLLWTSDQPDAETYT